MILKRFRIFRYMLFLSFFLGHGKALPLYSAQACSFALILKAGTNDSSADNDYLENLVSKIESRQFGRQMLLDALLLEVLSVGSKEQIQKYVSPSRLKEVFDWLSTAWNRKLIEELISFRELDQIQSLGRQLAKLSDPATESSAGVAPSLIATKMEAFEELANRLLIVQLAHRYKDLLSAKARLAFEGGWKKLRSSVPGKVSEALMSLLEQREQDKCGHPVIYTNILSACVNRTLEATHIHPSNSLFLGVIPRVKALLKTSEALGTEIDDEPLIEIEKTLKAYILNHQIESARHLRLIQSDDGELTTKAQAWFLVLQNIHLGSWAEHQEEILLALEKWESALDPSSDPESDRKLRRARGAIAQLIEHGILSPSDAPDTSDPVIEIYQREYKKVLMAQKQKIAKAAQHPSHRARQLERLLSLNYFVLTAQLAVELGLDKLKLSDPAAWQVVERYLTL